MALYIHSNYIVVCGANLSASWQHIWASSSIVIVQVKVEISLSTAQNGIRVNESEKIIASRLNGNIFVLKLDAITGAGELWNWLNPNFAIKCAKYNFAHRASSYCSSVSLIFPHHTLENHEQLQPKHKTLTLFNKSKWFPYTSRGMASIKERLFAKVADSDTHANNKVTVVGVGQVGLACAFSILTQVCFQPKITNKAGCFCCVAR